MTALTEECAGGFLACRKVHPFGFCEDEIISPSLAWLVLRGQLQENTEKPRQYSVVSTLKPDSEALLHAHPLFPFVDFPG